MCGIAGFVRREGRAAPEEALRQLTTLEHRGPDAEGVFASGPACIGQTRLAVIDLDTGDPPISAAEGRLGVSLNGEIYNYRELRTELGSRGHRFSTQGDTEVIAHLAEDRGPADVARALHGMFAFAVWDDRREVLVLGRDRLGKKPLYYWVGGQEFVFGSEIKAVLAHPAVPQELDDEVIPSYLTFGYVPTPRTFYRGILSLGPGQVLTVDRDLRVTIETYWQASVPSLDGSAPGPSDMESAARLVRTGLSEAVQRRLISDVPLGAFLSGGIDSSAIVGLMAEQLTAPVRTFTIGFEDQDGFDERSFATIVAKRFGTEHEEFVVDPDAVDLVEQLVWHHDQPFGDSSAIPTYLLSKLTKEHVTVALCGDGGDELFGGYERFAAGQAVARAEAVPGLLAGGRLLSKVGAPLLRRGALAKARRLIDATDAGMPDTFRSWISYVPDDAMNELTRSGSRWGIDDYQAGWEATSGAPALDRLLLLNLNTYLLDDLLPKVDRMSMAHGLEVRAPFLDHQLVELAFRLPGNLKVRGVGLKRVLKHAVSDLLPPEILQRGKRGFGVPLDRWFRSDLAPYLAATLGAPDARVREHLDGSAVTRLLAEHQSGSVNRGQLLWTLLTLEVFLRGKGW